MPRLRVIFMGTPEFSVPTLQKIIEAGHDVVAVYSQPPSRSGRGKKERPSPVHSFAQTHDLKVYTPKSLKNSEEQALFQSHDAEIAIVVAYGLLLPKAILDAPLQGCLNLHGSLLPRWRGAAPIQRALMAGDKESGVMVMGMEEGLDTGPFCKTYRCPLTEDMTAGQLHDTLMINGAELMVQALDELENGQLKCQKQPEDGVTYAKKIKKSESRIDWQHSAQDIHNQIRGLSPFPGCWFEIVSGDKTERVKILEASLVQAQPDQTAPAGKPGDILAVPDNDKPFMIMCGQGLLQPKKLQRAGKKPVAASDFLRGFPQPITIQ